MLLQRGVAAARSDRSAEARQLLQQVVELDPENEMAWLWLSGLMTTTWQKLVCLGQVLRINPDNVYARAGLVRLQNAPQDQTEASEASPAAHGSGSAPQSPLAALARPHVQPLQPRQEPLKLPSRSNSLQESQMKETPVEPKLTEPTHNSASASSSADPKDPSFPQEVPCPVCDRPISPSARRCPQCYTQFRPFEELLRGGTPTPDPAPPKTRKWWRKGRSGQ